jgi:hypothetical protein
MAAKTASARKAARAGKTKNVKSASKKKSKPGMLARATASITAAVKNMGARRAKRQAKVANFVADNMIVGKETAQNVAKKADARAARRQKAANTANRKATAVRNLAR